MSNRDERIEHYYHESAWDLAEWLVDAEDEIKMWQGRYTQMVEELERRRNE